MSVANPKNGEGGVRLWCVAASDAPIVCVIAKLRTDRSWTCILRWNWEKRTVEEGSWSTLRVNAKRTALSANGEFMLYHAMAAGKTGAFTAWTSGAFGISRLPWLTLLTNTDSFGPGGGHASKEPLSEFEQARLWEMFSWHPKYIRDEFWPLHFGRAFTPSTAAERLAVHGARDNEANLVASAPLHETDLRLVVTARHNVDKRPGYWSVVTDSRSFDILDTRAGRVLMRLPKEYRWVHPASTRSRLLAATNDAKLQTLCVVPDGDGARLEIEWEHDLSGLQPHLRPSPAWARASLRAE